MGAEMTKDEALKLALEALERSVATCFDRYSHDQVMSKPYHFINQTITAIKEALAQPEQEPVTLQINGIPPFKNPPNDVIDAAFHVSKWAQRNNWTKWRIGYCCSVDYTAPPQREWVGLTEEEKNDCLVSADPCECLAKPESHQLMEDVETKLREKNGC